MARFPRQFSESGYLHLMIKGNSKQIIFEEDDDFQYFLNILERYCKETDITVVAYCLMDNHVHLLVYDEKKNAPLLMKKLEVSYSRHFNNKYERSGHLFQGRYRSEAVEDDEYLLTVFRYILNNPQKAGICSAYDYMWSSYADYGRSDTFIDTRVVKDLIGDAQQYIEFIANVDDKDYVEYSFDQDDEWAKGVIHSCIGQKNCMALQAYDRVRRNEVLKELKAKGLSVRQIERLTGINRGVIQRA